MSQTQPTLQMPPRESPRSSKKTNAKPNKTVGASSTSRSTTTRSKPPSSRTSTTRAPRVTRHVPSARMQQLRRNVARRVDTTSSVRTNSRQNGPPIPKAVVYGPSCFLRTNACIAHNNVTIKQVYHEIVRKTFDFQYIPFGSRDPTRKPVIIWDVSTAKPEMNANLADFMINASLIIVAIPEQSTLEKTKEVARRYVKSARECLPPGVPLRVMLFSPKIQLSSVVKMLSDLFHANLP